MLFVYNNTQFLFIHIGGTAGTSVEYYFYSILNNIKHQYYENCHREKLFEAFQNKGNFNSHGHNKINFYKNKTELKDTTVFTIIRNPYYKILSKFFTSPYYKNLKNESDAKEKFNNFIEEIYVKKNSPFFLDQKIHLECQSNYLYDNELKIENIIKLENLEEEFKLFQEKYNLPLIPLLKLNTWNNRFKNINLYNDKSKEIVYQNNKKIIDEFYQKL